MVAAEVEAAEALVAAVAFVVAEPLLVADALLVAESLLVAPRLLAALASAGSEGSTTSDMATGVTATGPKPQHRNLRGDGTPIGNALDVYQFVLSFNSI
jgi:hypothetical protein